MNKISSIPLQICEQIWLCVYCLCMIPFNSLKKQQHRTELLQGIDVNLFLCNLLSKLKYLFDNWMLFKWWLINSDFMNIIIFKDLMAFNWQPLEGRVKSRSLKIISYMFCIHDLIKLILSYLHIFKLTSLLRHSAIFRLGLNASFTF